MNAITTQILRHAKRLETEKPRVLADVLRKMRAAVAQTRAGKDEGPRLSPWSYFSAAPDVSEMDGSIVERDEPSCSVSVSSETVSGASDFDDIVIDAFRHMPDKDLRSYSQATPLPAQRAIFERAVSDCVRAGLRLPHFTTTCVETVSRDCQRGQAHRHADGSYEVVVDLSCDPLELRRVICHELMHLHDFYVNAGRFDRVELEVRATRFAAVMMELGR